MSRLPASRLPPAWQSPLLVLVFGVLIALLARLWVTQQLDTQAQARFQALALQQEVLLRQQVELYPRGLRGLRGIFLDNPEAVDSERFRRYLASRDTADEFPGGLAWGYVERLPAAGAAAHLRQRHELPYTAASTEPDAEAWILRLLDRPGPRLPARGADLAGLAPLQAVARAAMHSGQPQLSAPIAWRDGEDPVLLLLLPVYQGVHMADNAAGWVMTALDLATLLPPPSADPALLWMVRDLGPAGGIAKPQVLYQQAAPPPLAPFSLRRLPPLQQDLRLTLLGRTWQLHLQAGPAFYTAADRWLPPLTLLAGLLLSLLGAGGVFLRQRLQQAAAAQRRQVAAAVQTASGHLQATLASLPDWVCLLDAEGRVVDCQPPPGLGLLVEPALGQPLASRLPAAVARDLAPQLQAALHSGHAAFEFELGGERQPRRYCASLRRLPPEPGQAPGVTLTVRDITAEHAARLALQQAEARLRQMFQQAPQAIMLCSRRRYLDANPAALQLFGLPDVTALQHAELGMFSPLLQPDGRLSRDAARAWMHKVEHEGPQHFEWTFQRLSDHGSFPAAVSVAPLRLDGETCFLYTIADVSLHKRAEAVLRQARDAAEAAAREKSEFLATVSHEIRTPMNGVLGMAQLLANTRLDPEQHDYVSTIQQSGQALLGVINDILDFSKIEAGKLAFEEVPFDLQVAVEETCELLLPELRAKGLTLTLGLDPALPFQVIGDPGRFRQVLLNYLGNAIKFTPQGGITIRLRAREQGRGAALFELLVIDTGIGIDPAKQQQLFRRFTQADASTTRRFGGTGLGLAICKALVERMGGEVSLRSTPGQGSEFRATFWLSLNPEPRYAALPQLLPLLYGKAVLVIDADAVSRPALVQGLRDAGLAAQGVASVDEACQALAERAVHFVLLDASDSDDAPDAPIHALRATPGMAGAALLLVSGRPDHGEHGFCREHGVAAFLTRPARLAWVLGCLNMLAGGRPAGVITRQSLVVHPGRDQLPPLRAGIRVLLAEDNPVNQKVAVRMLEKLGVQVDLAGNGVEALVMVSQLPYDLVLMDVQMPEMDGITATRSLRAQGFARLPIVALTANSRDSDRQQCRQAGMNDFLAKPIRYEDLHACLCRWVPAATAPSSPPTNLATG